MLTFGAAHAVEVLQWTVWFGNAYEPWFLNSGRAVAFMTACLFVSGLFAGWLRLSGLMFAAGAATAMTVVLFLKQGGAGTIFPIVIAAGGLIVASVSLLAVWLGYFLLRLPAP